MALSQCVPACQQRPGDLALDRAVGEAERDCYLVVAAGMHAVQQEDLARALGQGRDGPDHTLQVLPGCRDLIGQGDWRGVLLVGCLGGIGFTMSIFIANLAFQDVALLNAAKLGVLSASACAAIAGLIVGKLFVVNTAALDPVESEARANP